VALDTLSGFESEADEQDSMANIKSQIKRNKQNVKRAARNKAVRSELRTRTKVAAAAVAEGAENAQELTRLAIKRLDMAAAKGVIHKNAASRRKSRLMKKAAAAASTTPAD
jgi:small subunit ribosomal protein S20